MTTSVVLDLEEELAAIAETGLYQSREAFLSDAVKTLLAARPDLREAIACKLYEKGSLSLGGAAAWAGISVDDLKEALHSRGIVRQAEESREEVEAMAKRALQAAGRPGS